MSLKVKTYKKEYAQELFRLSQDDLYASEFLSTAPKARIETIIFLAHQAIKKAIKSYLCHIQRPILHTHELDKLLQSIPEADRPNFGVDLSELTEFATIRRYEEGPEIYTQEDMKSVLSLARKVLKWAGDHINS